MTPANRPKRYYTWEVQRQWSPGLWTHQLFLGKPKDPRGHEFSDLDPDEFARAVADRVKPSGEWQVMVWDLYTGPPVATLRHDNLSDAR